MVLEVFQTLHLMQKVINSKALGMVKVLTTYGAVEKMKMHGKEQTPVR